MKTSTFTILVAFAFSTSTPATSEVFFSDSFESGDMSATNSAGFNWQGNNRTSIVTDERVVYSNGEKNVPMPSGRDWEATDGDHSLRFRYGAGEEWAEQRFKLGRHYEDLWIGYWARVPINFVHGSLNNKFLSLWPESYDRPGTVTWQTRPNGSGGAVLVVQDGGVTDGERQATQFIEVPKDQGRWMHIVARVKSASGPNANDGIIQFYRRWEGENNYKKLHEKTISDTWDDTSNQQGISQGYILGWANDPFNDDTEWLVDEFTLSTTSLIGSVDDANPPNPPVLTLD